MVKRTINLAGKEFEIKINFRKSYELTKFRNKMSYGVDFSDADKDVIAEIAKVQMDVSNGKEVDVKSLSNETINYLNEISNKKQEIFNMEELIEIGKILTDIDSNDEIIELYDKEVEENGYDELLAKLSLAISTVFMNAKDTSSESKENQVA